MQIEFTPDALAQLADLPKSIAARIDKVLERLEQWPQVSGVKWLTGDWKNHARIRSGDYRVIFKLLDDGRALLIVRIAHRKESYAD